MVLSTETFSQSVRTEFSEAVNARYTFQPLWVSGYVKLHFTSIAVTNTSEETSRSFNFADFKVLIFFFGER